MGKRIITFDSTLRDGAQSEGVSFSLEDKLKLIKKLDEFGIDYAEAGNPGSNPKDAEFFRHIKNMGLKHIRVCAFGSTYRPGSTPETDPNLAALLSAETDVVSIFGKASLLHVRDVLKTTPEENLEMIKNTVSYLKGKGKEIIYDAEHFFDGYFENAEYAMKTIEAAVSEGADTVVLCDTKGACFPKDIAEISKIVCRKFGEHTDIGIHCHNDVGMAVAATIEAISAGCTHVQGTFTGVGERCGNACLAVVIANLQLKLGYECVPEENMKMLRKTARYINELANMPQDEAMPYVGSKAFAHKAGMHVDGVQKNPETFEHIQPSAVGNKRRFLLSEMAGRATVIKAISDISGEALTKESPEAIKVIAKLKEMEQQGYQFEGAEGSFELLVLRETEKINPFFELENFKVVIEEPNTDKTRSATAMIKVKVDSEYETTAAEGQGPVNALDRALRKALERFYPSLADVRLVDYKVRVLDGNHATASMVRVVIESTDGKEKWSTIGVSSDIIEASWKALVDSVEYKLCCADE